MAFNGSKEKYHSVGKGTGTRLMVCWKALIEYSYFES
jgi:hypothetical protein